MFEGFAETRAPGELRRWAVSAGTSVALYAAAAAAIFTLLCTGEAAPVVKKVEVVFRAPPPPAPEAAPPPARRPPPPPVPKKVKVFEVAAVPPPPPQLVAPAETPLERPVEAEPTGEPVVVAVASGGASGGASIGSATPPSEPIHLPEAATPPQRLGGGDPEYPEEARRAGREGLVILKIVIDEEGRVSSAEVLRGEEPFAAAAVRAVRTWRYRPATLAGAPISIPRVVKVPFRLRS